MKRKMFWALVIGSTIISVAGYLVATAVTPQPEVQPETQPVKITISYVTPFDMQEIKCLAENIFFEARGEPKEGQIAVAQVTINRTVSGKYPRTICAVVHQKKQFSWTNQRHKTLFRDNKKALDLAYKVYLQDVVFNRADDPTNGALFYHAKYVKPVWRKHMIHTTTIGNHLFYR